MINAFVDDTPNFLVLLTAEGRYELRRSAMAVPDGCSVLYGEDTRANCLAFIAKLRTVRLPSQAHATRTEYFRGSNAA